MSKHLTGHLQQKLEPITGEVVGGVPLAVPGAKGTKTVHHFGAGQKRRLELRDELLTIAGRPVEHAVREAPESGPHSTRWLSSGGTKRR